MTGCDPHKLVVKIQTYRDMELFGGETTAELTIGGITSVYMYPGAYQLNSADMLRVNISEVQRFTHGWYHGITWMTYNHQTIGDTRPFIFCGHTADAPSLVHFNPSGILVGWTPPYEKVDTRVYSFTIQPVSYDLEPS